MVLVGKPVFALFSFSIWSTECVCLLLQKHFSSVYMCTFIYEYNISVSSNQEPWTFWKSPQLFLCV